MKKQVFVCISPDGSFELWWSELAFQGDVWHCLIHDDPWTWCETFNEPKAWGREIIDDWTES